MRVGKICFVLNVCTFVQIIFVLYIVVYCQYTVNAFRIVLYIAHSI
jgi:hypothetical protein